MLTLVLLVVSALLLVKRYLIRKKNYWRRRGVYQIDGVVSKFMSEKRSLGEIYKDIVDQNPSHPYFGIFLGASPTLLLRDLRDIESVLQSNFNCFNNRGIVTNPREVLTDNLLFINDYDRWQLIKQKISPMFTNAKIKNLFQYIGKSARDFILYINNTDTETQTLKDLYGFSTSIISECIFGTDQESESVRKSLIDMFWNINEASTKNNLIFYISNTYPTLFKLLNLKHFNGYNEFFVNFVKQAMRRRRDGTITGEDIMNSGLVLQKDGVLKDPTTGYKLVPTDELLAAQYFFFFLGGTDNIATSLHFAMLELGHNKNILNRLHDEIDAIFDRCDQKLTLEELGNSEYLDNVVSELFRKYPPVFALQRNCTADTTLPSTRAKICKGTTIIVPVFALHRDPKYFPDPERFDPERFSHENRSKIVKFSYIPFGDGKRKCLGIRFAKVLLKFSIAVILRTFTLKEQKYDTKTYDPSYVSLRDSSARFKLLPRNVTKLQ